MIFFFIINTIFSFLLYLKYEICSSKSKGTLQKLADMPSLYSSPSPYEIIKCNCLKKTFGISGAKKHEKVQTWPLGRKYYPCLVKHICTLCFLLTELVFEDLLRSEHVLECLPESWPHPCLRRRTVLRSSLWPSLTITEVPHLTLQEQHLAFLPGTQVNPDSIPWSISFGEERMRWGPEAVGHTLLQTRWCYKTLVWNLSSSRQDVLFLTLVPK